MDLGRSLQCEYALLLVRALLLGRGVVFRHYYKSIAKCAGKDYRDGAVVPFE